MTAQDDRPHQLMIGEDFGWGLYVPKIWVDLTANLMNVDLSATVTERVAWISPARS